MTNDLDWEELSYFYYDKPVAFVEDIIGVNPTDQQANLLKSVLNNRATSAKAGHGVGKTAGEAWVVLWFMFTRAMCRIPCTALTGHQLNDILWSEIKKWYNQSKFKEYNIFLWTKTGFAFNDEEYNNQYKVKIKVDVTGIGAGVVDELIEKNLKNTIIIPVGFGEKAAEDDKYANKVTEMYFNARNKLKKHPNQIPNDEELIAQLSSRKYSIDSKDRFKIESKDKFKKRTGQSPDRADGFVLSYYQAEDKSKIVEEDLDLENW